MAGTSGDARTRVIAEKLSAHLGQRFIVENKPGAATTIGTRQVAGSKADGYTLLATFTPAYPVGPLLYKEAGYDSAKSFEPIAMFASGAPFLVVHPSIPVKTLSEFVALAKAKPGSITFAHAGLGNATHLPAELFRKRMGLEFLYVPFKSEADAMVSVLGGQVAAGFFYTNVAVPHIKAGKIRALAVANAERNPSVPDVPTTGEAGCSGCEFRGTVYLLAPTGTPKKVVSILNQEVASIMQEPDVRPPYAASGADPVYGTIEEVRARLVRETELNISLVKALNLSPE